MEFVLEMAKIKLLGLTPLPLTEGSDLHKFHELYHLYFHENFESIVCFTDLEMSKSPAEKEADMFASYFLAPYEALFYFIRKQLRKEKQELEIEDVVRIEQHFGMSRQAVLWRLINEGYLKSEKVETMKTGIIVSARKLGYDDTLYTPTPEDKQYATFGKYIRLAEELKERNLYQPVNMKNYY